MSVVDGVCHYLVYLVPLFLLAADFLAVGLTALVGADFLMASVGWLAGCLAAGF